MSDITLGLDVGPTSVGWALVDGKEGRIVDTGVRVFPEGVDRDQQGGEKSKNQTRRSARATRRQLARRARRKHQLRTLLTGARLLPRDRKAVRALMEMNPYSLRREALDQKLSPHEIGRVLLHLNQRRGFLSNRKTDRAKGADTKGMLAEINQLAAEIEHAGSRTLGEYLEHVGRRYDPTKGANQKKIRTHHTRRDMYEQEFDAIWEAQQKHHPQLLNGELKEEARRVVFFQRSMYWPKAVIGRCELEPRERRCPRADRAAQRFRILQEVNNLRLLDRETGEERPLDEPERQKVLAHLFTKKDCRFDRMRRLLGFSDAVQFNFERADRTKLQGHETDAALSAKKVLGKGWAQLPDDTKDAIVTVLVEVEQEDEALRQLAILGLSPQESQRSLSTNLPEGHMNFSRKAIDRLIPHLEKGMLLMGDDPSNSAIHAAGYLRPDEREINQREFLPVAPDLTNPIVRQGLVEVRKVVNAVIREYGRPDHIHVELVREAKYSLARRQTLRIDNAKRRRAREAARAAIEEYDPRIKPTRRTVNRYLLWTEQETFCPYCGQEISQAQLFSGEADVDHILPRWRSLDDSLANQVICHRKCNAEKGDRTAREWLEESDPARYELVLRVAERLPYNKQRKLRQKDIRLDEFVERQLRDTAYISRCVTQYLRCLGATIRCPRGQMTAELRHVWGLNTILNPEGLAAKNRADHRHHAVDALVIALVDAKRLHALANARGKDMPLPWDDFRRQAEDAIRTIRVSHRAQRGLHGALHEQTLYGPTHKKVGDDASLSRATRPWAKGWTEDSKTFVRRKPVTELTNTKHLSKVRDESIRQILREHLQGRGIDCDQPGKIPRDAFVGANTPHMPSGVPIKRVRMLEESETFRQVSEHRPMHFVKPGNNHHIVYRAVRPGGNDRWKADVVPMWDAALRSRRGEPIVDRSDTKQGRFVMALSRGEVFEIDAGEELPLLCVVRKIDQRSKRINYKLHTDARQAAEINKDNLCLSPEAMRSRNARKVTVDTLGRVRRAND